MLKLPRLYDVFLITVWVFIIAIAVV